MRPLRAIALATLVVAAPLWAAPSLAFTYADAAPRSVVAAVVADSTSYLALNGGSCNLPVTGGGTCEFTITNRGLEARTYSVTKLVDNAPASVASYQVTGGSSVISGATTSGNVAVGGSVTLTATLATCIPFCTGTKTVTWKIEARSGTEALETRNGFPMTLTYT